MYSHVKKTLGTALHRLAVLVILSSPTCLVPKLFHAIITPRAIGFARKRLNIKYKTLKHPKANEALHVSLKKRIVKYQSEGRTILYLDKSGFAKDMPHLHDYPMKGIHCHDTQGCLSKGQIHVIGAIVNFVF